MLPKEGAGKQAGSCGREVKFQDPNSNSRAAFGFWTLEFQSGPSPCFNFPVRKRTEIPVALTIAGSDSGGGAGVQADLKTFTALGVHGTCALTCLTAQNPRRVTRVEACSPKMLRAQIEAVFEELPPRAAKTGMLYSTALIREVARAWRGRSCPLVVDPVMVATSGARLLQPEAVRTLTQQLFPLAALVTPNVPEAEALLGMVIRAPEDLREAARKLHARFGCAALVKGGHLRGGRESVDIFYDGETEWLLRSPRVPGVKTHGTGCTFSAAIAAQLARGEQLPRAVARGKQYVTNAIANTRRAGGHDVLGGP